MLITTPSGHKVTVKDFITFGQRRQLERIILSNSKINPATQTMSDVSSGSLYEVQDKAVELLVTKIEYKDSTKIVTENFVAEIASWREEDGQAVYEAINTITQPKKHTGEKK